MKKYQFKTDINCQHCVAKVKPALDGLKGIKEWHVETGDKEKTLTVKAEDLDARQVKEAVNSAGFEATEKGGGFIQSLFGKK